MWDFFQRRVALALDEDWPIISQECERVGLSDLQRFTPIPIGSSEEIPGPHQSFNASTKQMLSDFYAADASTCLILEGDCVFQELDQLEIALKELPNDWDIVYLGANLICWNQGDEPKPDRHSDHLFRIRTAWTTHAIGYNRRVIPFLLENQPGFSVETYDNWLSRQLQYLNAYVVSPMVAWQRPHYSGIWGRDVDYTDIFIESQRRLI